MSVYGMMLLSHISSQAGEQSGFPEPADPRRMAHGFEVWEATLARAGRAAAGARAWSGSPDGRRLLAAIFGNSPYLSGIAVKEWAFLSSLVESGPDPLFAEILAAVEKRDGPDEDAAALMRRLRLAKRRVALLAALAELAGIWSLERQMAGLSRFAICCDGRRRAGGLCPSTARIPSATAASSFSAWANSAGMSLIIRAISI